MDPIRFKFAPLRSVFWLLAGLFLLVLSLPIALLLPFQLAEHPDAQLAIATAVCVTLAWMNLAWVCRTIGLLRAKVAAEVTVTDDGLFVRTVRRSSQPLDLLRPMNVWEERTISWADFLRCETCWQEYRGQSEISMVVVHASDGPPLSLDAGVFNPQLPAIRAAIDAAAKNAGATGRPMVAPPAVAAGSKWTAGRILKLVVALALMAFGIRMLITMHGVAVRDPWAYLTFFPIIGVLLILPVYWVSTFSVTMPPLGGLKTHPAGVQTAFPFVVSGRWIQAWLFFFGTFWFGMKLRAYRHQECARCQTRKLFAQYRFFRALHFYFVPVLPLGFGQRWACAGCGQSPATNPGTAPGGLQAVADPLSVHCPVCTSATVPPAHGSCLQCGVIRLDD